MAHGKEKKLGTSLGLPNAMKISKIIKVKRDRTKGKAMQGKMWHKDKPLGCIAAAVRRLTPQLPHPETGVRKPRCLTWPASG